MPIHCSERETEAPEDGAAGRGCVTLQCPSPPPHPGREAGVDPTAPCGLSEALALASLSWPIG